MPGTGRYVALIDKLYFQSEQSSRIVKPLQYRHNLVDTRRAFPESFLPLRSSIRPDPPAKRESYGLPHTPEPDPGVGAFAT